MSAHSETFAISFRRLLIQVTDVLGWPKPVFSHVGLHRRRCVVVVLKGTGPECYAFMGRFLHRLAASEEDAVEQAVAFLVKKYRVQVEDVNLPTRLEYEVSAYSYSGETLVLENRVREVKGLRAENVTYPSLPVNNFFITIDFGRLLKKIAAPLQVSVSSVNTNVLSSGEFRALLGLTCPDNSSESIFLSSGSAPTTDIASNRAARKAVLFLKQKYNFIVKDTNYLEAVSAIHKLEVARVRYLAAKKRVKEFEEVGKSEVLDHVKECCTPTGADASVHMPKVAPPPPKKPVAMSRICCSTAVMITDSEVGELEVVFRR